MEMGNNKIMLKKSLVFVFLFILVGGMAFAESTTFLQIENEILASRTYPEIRRRILEFSDRKIEKAANLEKRIRFYEGRFDTYSAQMVQNELDEFQKSKLDNKTIDYCLRILDSSGYTPDKTQELKYELFDTLGLAVHVRFLYSSIDSTRSDLEIKVYPYEEVTIPSSSSQDEGVTVSGWYDSKGKVWKNGTTWKAEYSDMSFKPIWNSDVLFKPGMKIDEYVLSMGQDDEELVLPDIVERGDDQSCFWGWRIDGTLYRPNDKLLNMRKTQIAEGVWISHDVELSSFEEVDGNGDGILQNGETGSIVLNLRSSGDAEALEQEAMEGRLTVSLYSPRDLEGIVMVSGKTQEFPMKQGILVQLGKDFESEGQIDLIAALEDSRGRVYYRDVDIAVSKGSLNIGLGQISYDRNRHELFVEVMNNSSQSTLVSPTFRLAKSDGLSIIDKDNGGDLVILDDVKSGSSTYLRYYLQIEDMTTDPQFAIEFQDKFNNSGTLEFTLSKSDFEAPVVEVIKEGVAFTDFRVNDMPGPDGILRELYISLGIFNYGEKALDDLLVEASADGGQNWVSWTIDKLEAGWFASTSGNYQTSEELKSGLLSPSDKPLSLIADPSRFGDDRNATILLRATTKSGKVFNGKFDWVLKNSIMNLALDKFELIKLGNGDEFLENGERFGVQLSISNNGLENLYNVEVNISSSDEFLKVEGDRIIVPLLKAGETTVVNFRPNLPLSTQLSGYVTAELKNDRTAVIDLTCSNIDKNDLKWTVSVDMKAYNPDMSIVNVFIEGKENFERVYSSDVLKIKPVIEYKGEKPLEKVRFVVYFDNDLISERASVVVGNLNPGRTVPVSFSRPGLTVSPVVPVNVKLPIRFQFTDSSLRSWIVDYDLVTGRRTFNILMEDIYLIAEDNSKRALEAKAGETVEIGFDARNIGLSTSPLVNLSVEVVQGDAEVLTGIVKTSGNLVPNMLLSIASINPDVRNRLLVHVAKNAVAGQEIVLRINVYSLMTVLYSHDFVLKVI